MTPRIVGLHEDLAALVRAVDVAVGATATFDVDGRDLYGPAMLAQGISARDRTRNEERGLTISHPDPGVVVLGWSWYDRRDGLIDEDHYRLSFDSAVPTFETLPGKTLEREDKRYRHTHHRRPA